MSFIDITPKDCDYQVSLNLKQVTCHFDYYLAVDSYPIRLVRLVCGSEFRLIEEDRKRFLENIDRYC